jgi:sulfonate transport system ATP-binding protein
MSTTTPPPTVPTERTGVQVRGLRRSYGPAVVLDNLDLTVADGEFICLLGASGCGKTTLLRILAGLDRPDTGDVRVPDQVAVVFQEPRLLPWRTVEFNVRFSSPGAKIKSAQARQALEEVGLAQQADSWPATLSGGQAQRAALARALVREPRLLLLDEPFAALDALTRIRMQSLVRELVARHHPASVLVTHDVDEAIIMADRVLVMADHNIQLDVDTRAFDPDADRGADFLDLRKQLLGCLGVTPH